MRRCWIVFMLLLVVKVPATQADQPQVEIVKNAGADRYAVL